MALLARWHGPAPHRGVALYVQLFQGTPLLMQLFLAYFGMALLGWTSAWTAAGLALTLYPAPFWPRSGAAASMRVPKGQWEAARSLA